MSALMLLFGNSEYIMGMRGDMNVIAFILAFVGVNAIFEIAASTIVTGAVGTALLKAKLIPNFKTTEA